MGSREGKMKVIDPRKYQELLEEIDGLIAKWGKMYPTLHQLAQVQACFDDSGFFITITFAGAERLERILRSVAWDLPDDIREVMRPVVRRWEDCLS
jgi:hypothetical protein